MNRAPVVGDEWSGNELILQATDIKTSCIAHILDSHPAAPGSILGVHNKFSLDVAEIY